MRPNLAITRWLAVLALLLAGVGAAPALAQEKPPTDKPVFAPVLQERLSRAGPGEQIPVIVRFADGIDRGRFAGSPRARQSSTLIVALQKQAAQTQQRARLLLQRAQREGAASEMRTLWIINGLAVSATPALLEELANLPEVVAVAPDEPIATAPRPVSGTPLEPNLVNIHVSALWALGWRGQGVLVANMDTGVDVSHPDLKDKWRGGDNSWFDPYGQHTGPPIDQAGAASGHGTWTMGVMVGGDHGGSAIGVAPAARWIAAKIFNDNGDAYPSAIHAAFQWLLDPDGDPRTPDAPDVVNGSWTFQTPGCNLEFEPDLQTLRAAGILPVFAAGNGGPNPRTDYSPANNPSAFSVGAVTNDNLPFAESSRGPTSCGGSDSLFPLLAAPGVNVRVADLLGAYTTASGTSIAAPHVSGVLALLLSAFPRLSTADQEAALIHGAVDLGASGPDNVFGYGLLDANRSFAWVAEQVRNEAPLTDAGPDQIVTLPAPIQLQGTVLDDGLPAPHRLTVRWDLVAGPGSAAFADRSAAQTTATVTRPGVYTFRLFADDGQRASGDDVIVSVEPPVDAPVPFYISLSKGGAVGGLAFADEDILAATGLPGKWLLLFDGSDVGLGPTDVDAFAVLPDGSLLLSTSDPISLPGVGQVDDSDVVRFAPTSLGTDTAGVFSLYFRGADAALEADSEDVDAITFTAEGDLVVSILGECETLDISCQDEDLLAWDAAGEEWSPVYRGSELGLSAQLADIWGAAMARDGALYVAVKQAYKDVAPWSDLLACNLGAPGSQPVCLDWQRWREMNRDLLAHVVDGIHIGGPVLYPGLMPVNEGGGAYSGGNDERNDDPNNGDVDALPAYRLHLPVIAGAGNARS